MTTKKSKKTKIISAIVFSIVLVGLMVFMFSGDNFLILKDIFNKDLTQEELREHLSGFGYKGVITLGLLSMLQVVFTFLPAEPVQVMAGISYGFLNGSLICLGGVIIGNSVIYLLHKIYGDRLDSYFDRNIDIDFEKASGSKRIALVIFILYFLPAIPYGLICFFASSLKMKYPRYITVTVLGSIPSICIGVGLGHVAIASSWIISITVFLVLVALLIVLFKKRKKLFEKVNEFLDKSRQNHSTRTTVKKYSSLFYKTLLFFGKIYYFGKFKQRVKKKIKNIEKPAIVICTHGSFIDYIYAADVLKNANPHFVVARMYFYHKKLCWLLRKLGCFPKSMFNPDVENARNCLKVIQTNRVLTMMPEARLSTVGKFEGIQEETFKFIKRMGVPVYALRLDGSYLANPKWGDGLRKGSVVDVSVKKIFSADEIKDATLEKVTEVVNEELAYNDFDWLKNNPKVKYKKKTLAEGLENILTLCPACRNRYTFDANKREIKCSHCGQTFILDDRYAFNNNEYFENFADWYAWQTEEYKKEILSNPDFCLSSKVELKHASKDGKTFMRHSGVGECALNKDGLTYIGEEDGKQIEKFFPLEKIYRLLFGAGEDFEIYEGEELYYFVPEEKKSAVDWYMVSGLLKQIYN